MNKIGQFFDRWEALFGLDAMKKEDTIGIVVALIPILSGIFATPILIKDIKSGRNGNKIHLAIDIIGGIMMILGLGFLLILGGLLISLGKKLKQACSSCGLKDQQTTS